MKNKFVKIAAVQNAVSNNLQDNLEKAIKLVEQAAKKGAQIICLQELYKTPYFPQYKNVKKDDYSETIPGESTKLFSKIAQKYKVVIIIPIFEKNKSGKYHNSAVVINADGKLMPTYRKIHIPQDPLFYEKNYFKEGDTGYRIYKTRYATFAVLICYDQWFPEAARAVKLAGADIIFYPTAIGNVKGVKETEGDWHDTWETIMRSHAIANSLHVVAVNRVGKEDRLIFWGRSFICDAFGKIIKRGSKNRDEIITSKIDLESNRIIENEWGFMRNRRTDTYKGLLI
ncbi:MAG: Porphyromonas-type peptidyl-arginine deiminase [Parcubacteria group bacterium GW2011_GWF2_38_8]|nr:MAG: Porphyromonas-type peptidyl-arginine deiminase [Parcubacteria group bacterium GW2011_GWF2_38_8]